MQQNTTVSCSITATDPTAGLGLEIYLDNQLVFDQIIRNPVDFAHTFNDADKAHELQFVMKNKTAEHTVLNSEMAIIKDANLIIDNIYFDQIDITSIFQDLAVYQHNFNGTGAEVEQTFYGEMGCNGTVNLQFSSPVYMWLLQHM
jgi:hypothetical protein